MIAEAARVYEVAPKPKGSPYGVSHRHHTDWPKLSPGAKTLYLELEATCGAPGPSGWRSGYIPQEYLAESLGCCVDSVRRWTRELEANAWVAVAKNGGKPGVSLEYFILRHHKQDDRPPETAPAPIWNQEDRERYAAAVNRRQEIRDDIREMRGMIAEAARSGDQEVLPDLVIRQLELEAILGSRNQGRNPDASAQNGPESSGHRPDASAQNGPEPSGHRPDGFGPYPVLSGIRPEDPPPAPPAASAGAAPIAREGLTPPPAPPPPSEKIFCGGEEDPPAAEGGSAETVEALGDGNTSGTGEEPPPTAELAKDATDGQDAPESPADCAIRGWDEATGQRTRLTAAERARLDALAWEGEAAMDRAQTAYLGEVPLKRTTFARFYGIADGCRREIWRRWDAASDKPTLRGGIIGYPQTPEEFGFDFD